MESREQDTICAVATAMSEAGIGIIRISGPEAINVADRLYRNSKGQRTLCSMKPNSIHFGYIIKPVSDEKAEKTANVAISPERKKEEIKEETKENTGECVQKKGTREETIDEVMVSVMRAPHSYTTEDTVEINCHGGMFLLNRILQLVMEAGARLALPGEFTKRAFLGGRLDLAEAEAVMDLISSQNEFSRKNSLAQLEGSFSGQIREIREKLIYEIAFIESALDDPENYSLDGYPEELLKKIEEIRTRIGKLLSSAEEGRLLKEGIRTVIIGKPNAGKSSLLNLLAGQERAIVTNVPGTTRDTLEETVRMQDVLLRLIDTAGIHETQDQVEKLGIERTMKSIEQAELLLFLIDASEKLTQEDREIAEHMTNALQEGKKGIILLNKSDLDGQTGQMEVENLFQKGSKPDILQVSMKTEEGIPALKEKIRELFHTGELMENAENVVTNLRHKEALTRAFNSLGLVMQSIEDGLSEDFFSIDLMNGYTALGEILGEQVDDDLVEEIFSKFCLGK